MLRETERLYDAIDALCGKRKAKLLKKLVRKAVAAERATSQWTWPYYPWWGTVPPYAWPYSFTISDGGISTTTIDTGTGDVATDASVYIYAGDLPGTVGHGSASWPPGHLTNGVYCT